MRKSLNLFDPAKPTTKDNHPQVDDMKCCICGEMACYVITKLKENKRYCKKHFNEIVNAEKDRS